MSTLFIIGLIRHVYVLWIWIIIRQYEAADGHTGYDLPYDPGHWIPFYNGATYHDFHHRKFIGNYAGFLNYIDRFFGTYAKGYKEYLNNKSKFNEERQRE